MENDIYSGFKPKMKQNTPGILNAKRTILISFSFFTVLLAWSYFNFKVPRILDVLIPEMAGKETLKGFVMAMDNLVAVILQPFFGDLSDRTRSKFGRRIPLILLGTSLSAIFFIIMPWVQFLAGFITIILLFDVSMSIYRSSSIAILPDYTEDKLRSKASSIQQFIANLGGVIGFAIPIFVGSSDTLGFLICGLLMITIMIVQFVLIKETPTGEDIFKIKDDIIEINPITFEIRKVTENKEEHEQKENAYKMILQLFKEKDKSFLFMLLAVFFSYLGFAGVEAFFSNFAGNYMGKADNVSGTLFLAYSVPMILTAPFWGLLGQRIGRKKSVIIGLIGIIIASGIFSFITAPLVYNPVVEPENFLTPTDILVMLNIAFISMPWMCFIVNSFPIIWGLAPKGKVGTYTGIYYTFNQLAYSLSPVIMGLILDIFGYLGDRQYIVLFPSVFTMIIIALIFVIKVKKGEVNLSKEELEEYERKYKKED